MNWYKIFYWISIADNVSTVTGTLAVIFGLITGVGFICMFIDTEVSDPTWSFPDWSKGSKTLFYIILTAFLFNITVWTFLPKKKDLITIVAAGSVMKFLSSDSSAKQIPHEVMDLVVIKLREWKVDALEKRETPVDTLTTKTKEELIKLLKEQQ